MKAAPSRLDTLPLIVLSITVWLPWWLETPPPNIAAFPVIVHATTVRFSATEIPPPSEGGSPPVIVSPLIVTFCRPRTLRRCRTRAGRRGCSMPLWDQTR